MAATISASMASDTAPNDLLFRKVFRRLIWFLFVLLVISFIDRINVAFAALTMNKALGLNATAFAMSITVFYVAYAVFEIPSNLILAKVGARLWIARIMITWGLASAATMFAVDAWSLFGLRALVGAAEAGFLPGILLYLTYWFPRSCRARANALFIMGIPATIAIVTNTSRRSSNRPVVERSARAVSTAFACTAASAAPGPWPTASRSQTNSRYPLTSPL